MIKTYCARRAAFGMAAAILAVHTPLQAGRTAIDEDQNGPIQTYLSGYCDLDGTDCTPDQLAYSVSIGGSEFSNLVTVHGNGLLSFGGSIDFSQFALAIENYEPVDVASYGVNLVSAGQNNDLVYSGGTVFFQSADLFLGQNGVINAQFYTCWTPQVCRSNPYSVTLTPTFSGPGGQSGYSGKFDFSRGGAGEDVGYVINGQFTATGDSFFLPAQFQGLDWVSAAVPEPGTWLTLILGFGLVGAALRARPARRPAVA